MYISFLVKMLKDAVLEIDRETRPLRDAEIIKANLEDGVISRKAKKYFKEKYNLILDKYNIAQMQKVLEGDMFILREKYGSKVSDSVKMQEVINALEYYQIVSPSLFSFIKEYLTKSQIPSEDIIKILEYVKIRNTNITKRNAKEKVIASTDLFLIINMISSGYEGITVPENENSARLDLVVKNIIDYMDQKSVSDVHQAFNLDMYQASDLNYIYSRLLKYFQDEIFRLIEILKNKEFYFDIAILEEIKDDYKVLYYKYMFVRNCLDENLNRINSEEEILEVGETPQEEVNSVLYTTNYLDDPSKCYFMKDLLDLREESLGSTFTLLKDFRLGKTSRIKHISYGYIELKDDQIRIILKPLRNREYAVIGVFIKKAQNDWEMYNKMFNRPIVMLNEEYSLQVDNFMEEYVRENARKGTRS